MDNLILRRARISDLHQLHLIESRVQPIPWSIKGLENEMTAAGVKFWVITPRSRTSQILAYICFRTVALEGYLLNIAVDEPYQGKGYGYYMLTKALDFWRKQDVRKVVLDVYKGNSRAISFYIKFGFSFACPPDKTTGKFAVMTMKLFVE